MSQLVDTSFPSSERFELRGELGAGAMGVVYRAYDRVHRLDVALKTLRSLDGGSLYRFKNEFRSLSGIVHANLVTLYELQSAAEQWFFTMELVEGESFLQHVRPYEHLLPPPSDDAATTRSLGPDTAMTAPGLQVGSRSTVRRECIAAAVLDGDRLRAALAQLARGLEALHRAGKVHRDVKPSNVLVETGGRVVVCDFGLVTDAEPGAGPSEDRHIAGTPAYMSPEQAAGDKLQPASDWYSLGVMIYEALTGQLPYDGDLRSMLDRKRTVDPDPPIALDPRVDPGLSELCVALLQRDPSQRPAGADIWRALEAGPATVAMPPHSGAEEAAPFVGRGVQQAALVEALAHTRSGKSVAVLVSGPSGMGKTTLIRRFLTDAVATGSAIVLEGRCYERESVPYKALDGLVDALSSHLLQLPDTVAASLVPPDIGSLVRLFPVLRRIDVLRAAVDESQLPADPQELRLRAFGALGQMLGRVAARQATIVHIDDLQWGDVDSAFFLEELIHRPRSPSLLFVGCYRSDEVRSSQLLQALLDRKRFTESGSDVRMVQVESLQREEARALAVAVLGGDGESAQRTADEIAREAGGNPFFVTELARAAGRVGAGPAAGRLNLDDVLHRRITDLPEEARALLTAAAVAGKPTPLSVVSRAAGIHDEPAAVAVLLVEHLARTRTAGSTEQIETSHDRIREVATARLSQMDLRRVHRRLARSFESSEQGDLLALVEHWLGAGVPDRAAACAVRAAAQAEETLAFDRAVYHYRLALELLEQSPDARRDMQIRLAHALANSGNLSESAETYLIAAEDAAPDLAGELRRRALKHLLRSGRNDKGLALAKEVLSGVGLKLPRSQLTALLSVAISRARLAVRGVEFAARSPDEIQSDEIRRLDVFWSVGSGLSLVDPMLGTAFQMRNLLAALRVGEPYRAALALSMEIGYRSYAGGRARDDVARLAASTKALAETVDSPHALAVCLATTGLAHFSMGDFAPAQSALARAEEILLDTGVGERWDLGVCRTYRMGALWYLGRIAELRTSVTSLLREAVEFGDEFLARGLRAGRSNVAWLAFDDPDEARRQVELAAIRDRGRAFHMPHFYELFARCQIELYEGDGAAAWRLMEASWPALKRSMLMRRSESIRISAYCLRARCALAAAAADPGKRAVYERAASAMARRLRAERNHWNLAKAALVRARVHAASGEDEAAAAALADAADRFDSLGMALHAAVARYRLGELRGSTGGDEMVEAARAWMLDQGIANPARMVAMIAPG